MPSNANVDATKKMNKIEKYMLSTQETVEMVSAEMILNHDLQHY
jgi:hypothetical protein